MLNSLKKKGKMKTSIVFGIVFGVLSAGCSTNTYLSSTENSNEQIEQILKDCELEEGIGAEITLSLKNGEEINGELLFVRDSTIVIYQQYSVAEEELANLTYPITTVQTDEIKEVTIEGSSYVFTGIGAGLLVGSGIGYIVVTTASNDVTFGALIGGGLIIIAASVTGGIIGNANSTDDIILSDISPPFDLSLLKPLSRYQDKEPEFLRRIQ